MRESNGLYVFDSPADLDAFLKGAARISEELEGKHPVMSRLALLITLAYPELLKAIVHFSVNHKSKLRRN